MIAAFGPSFVIGIGLLAYNFLRFGELFEFGMRYQLAGQNFSNFSPLGFSNLMPHLRVYSGNGVWWLPYFPFVETNPETPFGLFRYLPLTWFGLFALYPCRVGGEESMRPRLLLACCLLGLGVANLVLDSTFFFQPELRYVSDFAPAFLLLGCIGVLTVAQLSRKVALGKSPEGGARIARSSLGLVLAVFVQVLPATATPGFLVKASNRLAALFPRAYGQLHLQVELPATPAAASEIFCSATGSTIEIIEIWLKVHLSAFPALTRLGWFSRRSGGDPEAGRSRIGGDRLLDIRAATSAFPAARPEHPFFKGWSDREVSEAPPAGPCGRGAVRSGVPCPGCPRVPVTPLGSGSASGRIRG